MPTIMAQNVGQQHTEVFGEFSTFEARQIAEKEPL